MPSQDWASLLVLIFAVNLFGRCAILAADRVEDQGAGDRHGPNHPAVLINFDKPALVYIHDKSGTLSKMELRAWVRGCLPGFEYSATALELDLHSPASLLGFVGKAKGRWVHTFTVTQTTDQDGEFLLRAVFPNPSPSVQHIVTKQPRR